MNAPSIWVPISLHVNCEDSRNKQSTSTMKPQIYLPSFLSYHHLLIQDLLHLQIPIILWLCWVYFQKHWKHFQKQTEFKTLDCSALLWLRKSGWATDFQKTTWGKRVNCPCFMRLSKFVSVTLINCARLSATPSKPANTFSLSTDIRSHFSLSFEHFSSCCWPNESVDLALPPISFLRKAEHTCACPCTPLQNLK